MCLVYLLTIIAFCLHFGAFGMWQMPHSAQKLLHLLFLCPIIQIAVNNFVRVYWVLNKNWENSVIPCPSLGPADVGCQLISVIVVIFLGICPEQKRNHVTCVSFWEQNRCKVGIVVGNGEITKCVFLSKTTENLKGKSANLYLYWGLSSGLALLHTSESDKAFFSL